MRWFCLPVAQMLWVQAPVVDGYAEGGDFDDLDFGEGGEALNPLQTGELV